MLDLPLATIKRLIQKSGTNRVSESAVIMLAKVLEEHATTLTIEAAKLSWHAGRKTVKDVDIRLAAKRILK